MDALPGSQLRGTVTSHFVNVSVYVGSQQRRRACVCVCVNISERGREGEWSVSGRRLSDEICVMAAVFLDVKLSLKPGFLQTASFTAQRLRHTQQHFPFILQQAKQSGFFGGGVIFV